MDRLDRVWKSATLAKTFLEGVRGGIPFAAEQIDAMLRVIAAPGKPIANFADLGCGSGVLAHAILARYPQAHSTLVDFSEVMINEARVQLERHVPQPRFVVADLATPAWVAAAADTVPFDVVVSGYAIHHLPDPRKRQLYGEIFGLLAPGGIFVNVEHVASHSASIEAMSDDLMIDSLYAFHVRQGSSKTRAEVADEFVHRPDKQANILAAVELQCEWLRACGFADVDCFFKVFELAVFGGHRPAAQTVPSAATVAPPHVLRTERLLLRLPRLDDAEAIFHAYAADAEVTRFLAWRRSQKVAETAQYVRDCIDAWRAGSRFPWIITRAADGRVIGAIELRPVAHAAEVGYVLARAEWGKGYATEALKAVLDAALAMPGVHRVWAACAVDNLASARVMEKAGMAKEGRLRCSIVLPNISAEPCDAFCYAKTLERTDGLRA